MREISRGKKRKGADAEDEALKRGEHLANDRRESPQVSFRRDTRKVPPRTTLQDTRTRHAARMTVISEKERERERDAVL